MGKYGAILIIASIILALVAWWRSAARNSPAMRVLGLLMGMAFLVEVTGFITRSGNYNNSPMYNSFVCTEFVLVLGLARLTVPKWRAHLSLAGLVGMLVLWGDLALGRLHDRDAGRRQRPGAHDHVAHRCNQQDAEPDQREPARSDR